MPVTNRFVFDSFALIGYLEDEKLSDRIEQLLRSARAGDTKLYLHAIHSGVAIKSRSEFILSLTRCVTIVTSH